MKKLSLLVIIFSITLSAQWYQQQSGTENYLSDVVFTNISHGFIVGEYGMYVSTTDGGENWAIKDIGTNRTLNGIFFIDSITGYIVGNSGTILKTSDGGISWQSQISGTTVNLTDVNFYDCMRGIVVGVSGTILRTSNGGSEWAEINNGLTEPLYGVSFSDNNNGITVGGNGLVLKTSDGGLSWTDMNTNISGTLRNISYPDSNNAMSVSWTPPNAAISFNKTTNGGITWNTKFLFAFGNFYYLNICFINPNFGFVVGEDGRILRTTDEGESWVNQICPGLFDLTAVTLLDTLNGFIVGRYGTILRTTNGGVTFIENEFDKTPSNYSLLQNYPNPFNPNTTIKYQIPELSIVTIKVYDILGREVATLVNEEKPAGSYEVEFNPASSIKNPASGIYFYKLCASEFSETKKMILLK